MTNGRQVEPRRKPREGTRVCPNCGGKEIALDEARGESVCKSCGLVLSVATDTQPAESKVRNPGDLGSEGLGYGRDYAGRELTARARERMRRLRGVERGVAVGGRERRDFKARAIIAGAIERLELPASYVDDALELYRGASRAGGTAGRSADVCAAASIYVVARQRGATRTMREVAAGLSIDVTELRRCYMSIVSSLGLKVSSSDPRLFVSKYVSTLGLRTEVERRAIDTLLKVRGEREVVGKNPVALAAAAVYLACSELGERVTQREVSRVFGVSDVSLRNRLRDLKSTMERQAAR